VFFRQFLTKAATPILAIAVTAVVGASTQARAASMYEVGDAIYGAAAIEITFLWDGNPNNPLTDFTWSTPTGNSAVYGTVTDSDVLWWDSIGFPDGFTDLADYLLSGHPTWSEDCTGPSGGVSPAFCNVSGSHIDLGILDAVVGTYGFQLNRDSGLIQADSVQSGTLVNLTSAQSTPEPPDFVLLSGGLLILCGYAGRCIQQMQSHRPSR
jgi:hypothetical protein